MCFVSFEWELPIFLASLPMESPCGLDWSWVLSVKIEFASADRVGQGWWRNFKFLTWHFSDHAGITKLGLKPRGPSCEFSGELFISLYPVPGSRQAGFFAVPLRVAGLFLLFLYAIYAAVFTVHCNSVEPREDAYRIQQCHRKWQLSNRLPFPYPLAVSGLYPLPH